MASGVMARNDDNIPHSALYTSATWKWAAMPCADFTTPEGAEKLFSVVNAYMRFYRFINPKKYSLHHTLLHRHAMINHLLERADCRQIIEVAAGFSPRGAHYSTNADTSYFEVDLEDVVNLKRNQLQRSAQGQSVLARENFRQIACDILKLDFSQAFTPAKSFVITEGLMMYFSRDEQLQIWKNIADFIRSNGGEYVFDYIPLDIEPERSAVGRALHFLKECLGGDGQGYCYDQRGRWDVRDDLLAAGFESVDVFESSVQARQWSLPHGDVATHVIVYRCR